jgi:hypothetical protein
MVTFGEASANQVAEASRVTEDDGVRHKEMGIEMVDQLIKVVKVMKTCGAFPAQWEGKTEDGKDVYVRYRWGNLRVHVANVTGEDALYGTCVVDESYGDELCGELSYGELKELTKDVMEWPLAEEQV